MINIYCDGVFDLFHKGHLLHLKKIKELFDEKIFLIVGVIDDQTSIRYKRKPIFNENQRKEILNSCIYIDKVIVTNMLHITKQFIEDNKIDYIVHAFFNKDDENKQADFHKIPIKMNKFIPIEYNKGISTTEIIKSGSWQDIWEKKGDNQYTKLSSLNGWEETSFNGKNFIANFLKISSIKNNEKILEMGCGAGFLAQYLTSYNYTGVDLSRNLVNKHINILNNIVLNFSSVDIIFKDKYFDYSLCNSMLEYLDNFDDLDLTIYNLERVTRKGLFIGNIRHSTRTKKTNKHKFDGVFTHLVIPKEYFLKREYIILENKLNPNERYNVYKVF